MDRLRQRFAWIAAGIVSVLAAGTTGFTLIEGYPLLDAFYMSLTTVTTVGYGEIHPLSRAGRIFNIFLIVIGVTMIFLAIGAMTQSIVEVEFGDFIEKRRVRRMIERLDKHYILCGFGRVGRGAAAEMQRSGVPFVVVDRDESKVERAMRAGMLAVVADSTRDETLREVAVDRARGLVAALATDADNLFLILSAKTLNPGILIAARAGEEDAEQKLRRVGADVVYTPYSVTGYRLAQSLMRPHVSEFLDFATKSMGLNVTIEQVQVGRGSEFCSKSLRQMQLRRDLGVIVLAIRKADGAMLFNPPAEAEVNGGDILIVMGEPDRLRNVERLAAEVRA